MSGATRIEEMDPLAAESRTQRLARDWRAALDALEPVVAEIDAARNEAVVARLDLLQGRAEAAAEARAALLAAVRARPDLFRKPRSRSVLGVKFGWRKKTGRVRTAKDTLDLIRSKLAAKASWLIRTTEVVATDRLRDLSVRELAAIGATVVDSSDQPFADVDAGDAEAAARSLLAAAARPAE